MLCYVMLYNNRIKISSVVYSPDVSESDISHIRRYIPPQYGDSFEFWRHRPRNHSRQILSQWVQLFWSSDTPKYVCLHIGLACGS